MWRSLEVFVSFRINALPCRPGVFGLVCCCLAMLVSVLEVYCELFSVKPNLKEQFIGYANFYWALSLAITVVSLFVTSG